MSLAYVRRQWTAIAFIRLSFRISSDSFIWTFPPSACRVNTPNSRVHFSMGCFQPPPPRSPQTAFDFFTPRLTPLNNRLSFGRHRLFTRISLKCFKTTVFRTVYTRTDLNPLLFDIYSKKKINCFVKTAIYVLRSLFIFKNYRVIL